MLVVFFMTEGAVTDKGETMPNWCDNTITISGDDESLDALWQIIKPDEDGGYANLTKAFPCPQPLKDTVSGFIPEGSPDHEPWKAQQAANLAKYGHTDWYEWCIANWGTKWSPEFSFSDPSEDDLTLWGDSAWSPPVELLKNISEQFPTLTFRIRYHEAGCDFVGAAVVANGVVVESSGSISTGADDEEDYDSEEYWEYLTDRYIELEEAHATAAEALWAVRS